MFLGEMMHILLLPELSMSSLEAAFFSVPGKIEHWD
jgi:hypothetical protein